MPAKAEHAAKYLENRTLLNGPPLLSSISPQWAATVAFYAAVHLIEKLAAHEGVHHARHVGMASRDRYLATHATHHVLISSFSALFSASILARYETSAAFAAAYPGDMVQAVLIDKCLAKIESHVQAQLP